MFFYYADSQKVLQRANIGIEKVFGIQPERINLYSTVSVMQLREVLKRGCGDEKKYDCRRVQIILETGGFRSYFVFE